MNIFMSQNENFINFDKNRHKKIEGNIASNIFTYSYVPHLQ